jgi:hypothetical protein
MKKYLLIGIFLVAIIMPSSVFAECYFDKDGTISCVRGGVANSGMPCTLFHTTWRYPVVLLAGLAVILPTPFPGDRPEDLMRYIDYYPTWDGAAAKFYTGYPSVRFTVTGRFTCHAGPNSSGPFTKVSCQDVIQYWGKAEKGNC